MDVLFECLRQGTSPAAVVAFAKEYLISHGFTEVSYTKEWEALPGMGYVMCPYPDTLFAFKTGYAPGGRRSPRMAFAHVDSPCLKLKGKPDLKSMDCALLNVEIYGGMMDHTWFDRPLGLSGQIVLKGEEVFDPQVVTFDSGRPIAVIPGLAIHMKRDANEGWKIDRQKEMMPLTGLAGDRFNEGNFVRYLAEEIGVDDTEILSYDLNLYHCDAPKLFGLENEFILSPRLDDLASVSALLESIVEARREDGVNLIGLFDHEEVGSQSRSGAHSELLRAVLARVFDAVGCERKDIQARLKDGWFLSLDGAHAAHPNYPERADVTTRAYLGQGPAVKINSTMKYATDCVIQGILSGLAEKYDIPLQLINDNNTIRGGMTIGPMIAADLPMGGCDIGIPMLAMHSASETCCAADYESLCQLMTAFFSD